MRPATHGREHPPQAEPERHAIVLEVAVVGEHKCGRRRELQHEQKAAPAVGAGRRRGVRGARVHRGQVDEGVEHEHRVAHERARRGRLDATRGMQCDEVWV